MASKTAISEEEYLRTSFPDLDREFRDGEVVERSIPDLNHSIVQGSLIGYFWDRRFTHKTSGLAELRLRLRPGRTAIPDVSVFWPERPTERVPTRPPLIAIEIQSQDDPLSEVREKLKEYADGGVPHIWLIDPYKQVFYVFKDGLHEVKSLPVPELSLTVTPDDIFE